MRRLAKEVFPILIAVCAIAIPSTAGAEGPTSTRRIQTNEDCAAIALPLGPHPVDRATVLQTMDRVQQCFTQAATSTGSSSRYALTRLLLIVVCLGALAIAGLLFWQVKAVRSIATPIAIGIALLSAVAATLAGDQPREGGPDTLSRLQRAKWQWAVRITRSNQMAEDPEAIDEAIAATNEFVTVAMGDH